jgi:glycosyltransferase involved in cell wall biosynthesis
MTTGATWQSSNQQDLLPAIDVLITTGNSDHLSSLVAAITRVRRQLDSRDQLVVVVDGNAALHNKLRLAFGDTVRVLFTLQPRGSAAARNIGVQALGTNSEVIAFLDDDVLPTPDWLARLRYAYRDPQVLAVSGPVIPPWEEQDAPFWLPPELYWTIGCSCRFAQQRMAVPMELGSNVSFRRQVFDEIGLFTTGQGQSRDDAESEFCIRLKMAIPAGQIIYDPTVVVQRTGVPAYLSLHHLLHRSYVAGRQRFFYEMAAQHAGQHPLPPVLRQGLGRRLKALLYKQQPGTQLAQIGVLTGAILGEMVGYVHAIWGHILGRSHPPISSYPLPVCPPQMRPAPAVIDDEQPPAARVDQSLTGAPDRPDRREHHKQGPAPLETGLKQAHLKVALVTPRYAPAIGGVETHTRQLSERLAQLGVEVTVLTTTAGGASPGPAVVNGISVQRVRYWPQGKDYYFAPGIYRALLRGNWDLIHCQGYHTLVPVIAMLAALHKRTPYIVTFHSGGYPGPLYRWLRKPQLFVLRPLLRGASRLLCVSAFEREHFAKVLHLPQERFVVISNGMDVIPVHRPARITGQRAPLIVSVGRLVRYKRYHLLIAAFARLRQDYPDARLVIVGSGPEEAALRRQIAALGINQCAAIRAIPVTRQQEIWELLAQADLFVLLSEHEGQGLAVMEALMIGTPVLVADTSALAEIARKGWAQAVPADASPATVAAAMAEMLRNPAPWSSPAIQFPTWDACARAILTLYQEVLHGSRSQTSTPEMAEVG